MLVVVEYTLLKLFLYVDGDGGVLTPFFPSTGVITKKKLKIE